jgi:hypothetical protein
MAPDGWNVEGHGEVYTRTIAQDLARYSPGASPREFVNRVASTAAHELSHMMGVRHAMSGPTNNVMRYNRSRGQDYVLNGSVATEGGPGQNAWQELLASFRGQATVSSSVKNAVRDVAGEGESGPDCCCSLCAAAREGGFPVDAAGVLAGPTDAELPRTPAPAPGQPSVAQPDESAAVSTLTPAPPSGGAADSAAAQARDAAVWEGYLADALAEEAAAAWEGGSR